MTSSSSCRVIAAATLPRGRWVVASATRSRAVASIITGRAAPVRRASHSVCPEKATPASLIVLFCTGAVTSAARSCPQHSATPVSSCSST